MADRDSPELPAPAGRDGPAGREVPATGAGARDPCPDPHPPSTVLAASVAQASDVISKALMLVQTQRAARWLRHVLQFTVYSV